MLWHFHIDLRTRDARVCCQAELIASKALFPGTEKENGIGFQKSQLDSIVSVRCSCARVCICVIFVFFMRVCV